MEEKDLIKIEVSAKTHRFAGEKGEETFLAFKGFTKRGWVDLKFVKAVENQPTKSCFIYVKPENVNINRTGRFPVIWVKAIEKIEEISFTQNVKDYFGD